jgi:hypothetical protein
METETRPTETQRAIEDYVTFGRGYDSDIIRAELPENPAKALRMKLMAMDYRKDMISFYKSRGFAYMTEIDG